MSFLTAIRGHLLGNAAICPDHRSLGGWRQAIEDGPHLLGKINAPGCEAALEEYGSYGKSIDARVFQELDLIAVGDASRDDQFASPRGVLAAFTRSIGAASTAR